MIVPSILSLTFLGPPAYWLFTGTCWFEFIASSYPDSCRCFPFVPCTRPNFITRVWSNTLTITNLIISMCPGAWSYLGSSRRSGESKWQGHTSAYETCIYWIWDGIVLPLWFGLWLPVFWHERMDNVDANTKCLMWVSNQIFLLW